MFLNDDHSLTSLVGSTTLNCVMSPSGGVVQELQQKRAQRSLDVQHVAGEDQENTRQTAGVGRKKPPKISPINRSGASPSNNSPISPTDVKAKNTGMHVTALLS